MESENGINQHDKYSLLIEAIQTTYQSGLDKVALAINMHLVLTYWQIGQYIVAFEQKGNSKAQYGIGLLE